MWNVRGLLVGVGLSACAFALGAGTADARIICRGQFQIVDGRPIATPYCVDSNVAAVAQEYGIAVSAREVRRNPGTKARVCRVIGHDNRVRSACLPYINTGKHRWWWGGSIRTGMPCPPRSNWWNLECGALASRFGWLAPGLLILSAQFSSASFFVCIFVEPSSDGKRYRVGQSGRIAVSE